MNDAPVGATSLCFLVAGPDCDSAKFGGFAVEASGLARRWWRWALGWSASYEVLFASVHRPGSAGEPASSRSASAGGPRIGLQLLRVSPPVVGAPTISPTTAGGVEVFAAYEDLWRGDASGPPLTFGVGILFF